jgi:hypothetical protein
LQQYLPEAEAALSRVAKRKPPEGGSLNLNSLIVDQAAINAGFAFRR